MTAPTLYPWRLARVLRQLSQVEVSRRAAVNQSYYSQIERHQVRASAAISARLWAVLAPSGDYETTPVVCQDCHYTGPLRVFQSDAAPAPR
ncbi:helix-turn-helix domain-containing protein [Sulfobacillus sp. hq2]|uniref:helix-turn-helix domain-containing protein n=1 Tax=Sulfobacillus sp. hq2 TaxID=2039167 RepID=UPI000CD12B46|nr:helix-turn-helix transcriptional regulator [Sulfobacillus sp. hq2]POB12176.1 hypothetical protein CO251_00690 [Sulfobacillus sp. hq2]